MKVGTKTRIVIGPSVLALLGATTLAGCSWEPRDPVVAPRPAAEDDKVARQSAYAGMKKDDDFEIPEAKSVSEPADEIVEEAPAESGPHAVRLGAASIAIGAHPPWESTKTLDEAPQLAHAAAPQDGLPTKWTLARTIRVGKGYLYQAGFTADQKSVLTLSTDNGVLYRYDVATGKLLGEVQLPGFTQFEDAAFSVMPEIGERPQVLVARESGTVVLDLESGRFDPLEEVQAGNGLEHTSRYGLYGVTHRRTQPQSGSFSLQWIHGDVALTAECSERPDDWALSSDGKLLAFQYYPSNRVDVLDLQAKSVVATAESPKWGGSVAFSPDAKYMALGGEKLVVLSVADGKVLFEDTSYKNNIDDIKFTPQGDLLLVSAYDGMARSYALPKDLSSLEKAPKPQELRHAGSANVYGIGLSQDTRLLVTSSGDQTLKIWKR